MKKGLLIILLICLLLPVATANIDIDGPTQSKFNVGDKISVSGSILEDEDISGYMQLTIVCYDQEFPLQRVPIEISSGEKVFFSALNLPNILVTSSMEGYCHIQAELIVSNNVVEDEVSSSFEVVRDMEGSFDVSDSLFQLGDTMSFTGKVEKMDGSNVDGSAEIYFEQDNIEYLVDSVPVTGGYINYDYSFVGGYPDKYSINLVVRDYYGNVQSFSNAGSFELMDDLYVYVESDKESLLPGETLTVSGEVQTAQQDEISTGSVVISFGDNLYSTSLSAGAYSYSFVVPKDIESGDHKVEIEVEDGYGNSGLTYKTVEVEPLATRIEVKISNSSFMPQDTVEVKVGLYDQADELMEGLVNLVVYDSGEDIVSTRNVESGEELLYEIPQFGEPGLWRAIVTLEELSDEDSFTVSTFSDLEIYMEGEILYIRNIGNTKYTDDIELEVEGEDGATYKIKRTKNLAANETMIINLAEEIPSGSYSVGLPTGLSVNDLVIENGTPRKSLTWLYTLLALMLIGGLSYMVYTKVKPIRNAKAKTPKKFMNDKPPMKIEKSDFKVKKKKSSLHFDDKNKSIADFKQRVMSEIHKTEEMDKRRTEQKKLASVLPKNGNNPFRLFD